jgi:hypothetical protein
MRATVWRFIARVVIKVVTLCHMTVCLLTYYLQFITKFSESSFLKVLYIIKNKNLIDKYIYVRMQKV